ncbi:protein BCCIP homolog isoform X2 [Mya arenaria]|uniref:protein BCCIP homolog isoform X2 n=1 Tax=Mya arenaria TaxID=6604 RepID=UPI0022DFA88B|nr:protein BCCIP homolog isoform X2 [Mya arenaria]
MRLSSVFTKHRQRNPLPEAISIAIPSDRELGDRMGPESTVRDRKIVSATVVCTLKMAASKKKRVEEVMEDDEADEVDDENNDIDDEEDDDESEDEAMDQEVQLDFEARVPEDSDFNGMRTLLQQVFLKANVNMSQLTDTIISQNYIGSVIKQPYNSEVDDDDDDDDDCDDSVLALTTVINLTERKELECVKEFKSMVLEKCRQCAAKDADRLDKLLSDPDHQVGYLISERFLNLPPTLTVPLFESLMKEMQKACDKKMKYSFSYYVMICKTYEMKTAHNVREMIYSNSEEELFQEVSEISFRYSVADQRDGVVQEWSAEKDMEPFRTVLVIPGVKLAAVVEKIKQEVAKT